MAGHGVRGRSWLWPDVLAVAAELVGAARESSSAEGDERSVAVLRSFFFCPLLLSLSPMADRAARLSSLRGERRPAEGRVRLLWRPSLLRRLKKKMLLREGLKC